MMSLDCFQLLECVISVETGSFNPLQMVKKKSLKSLRLRSTMTHIQQCVYSLKKNNLTLLNSNTCFDRGSSIKKMDE